jgi:hypothetical protein
MEPEYSENGKFCVICWGQLQEYVTDEGKIVYQCLLHGEQKHVIELPPQCRTGERTLEEVDAYFQKADQELREILIVTRGVIQKDALLSCGKLERGRVGGSRKILSPLNSDRTPHSKARLILLPFLAPLFFFGWLMMIQGEKQIASNQVKLSNNRKKA